MKTVEIVGERHCQLIDKPMPTINDHYSMIKVHVSPMCNEHIAYDKNIYLERNQPDSLGHEMAGEVVETSKHSTLHVGQRVVALCGFPCGECSTCQRGYYAHCTKNFQDPRQICHSVSGECSFAQYAIKPNWMLIPIPDHLSYEHASMACCGLGPTFGAMQRMTIKDNNYLLITGLGPVGLGGIINAKYRGATVIAVVRSTYRAKLAKKLGCDYVINPNIDDPLQSILDITHGYGVAHAIECSGQQQYQRLVIDALGRFGVVCFLSEPGDLTLHIDNDLIQKGATLFGSLDINLHDASHLLKMIASVPDQIDKFITHKFPLSDIATAFEIQLKRECGKILLYPWDGL